MREIWKDIKGYEGIYKVSNYGEILNIKTKYKLKPSKINGYTRVHLTDRTEYIHILVAKTFIKNPGNKPCVNHIDGNKQNNKVDNLEWCTPKENINHAWNLGLCEKSRKMAKRKVIQYDKNMNFICEWESIREASTKLKLHESNISSCCSNKIKTTGGFIWKYAEKKK